MLKEVVKKNGKNYMKKVKKMKIDHNDCVNCHGAVKLPEFVTLKGAINVETGDYYCCVGCVAIKHKGCKFCNDSSNMAHYGFKVHPIDINKCQPFTPSNRERALFCSSSCKEEHIDLYGNERS